MREIKFRGKRTYNGQLTYGSLLVEGEEVYISGLDGMVKFMQEVEPETVGQYTGLKDKNGREIYEGDIVEYDGGKTLSRSKMLVEWIDGGYVLSAYREDWAYYLGDCLTKSLEIIGNSYENPEL